MKRKIFIFIIPLLLILIVFVMIRRKETKSRIENCQKLSYHFITKVVDEILANDYSKIEYKELYETEKEYHEAYKRISDGYKIVLADQYLARDYALYFYNIRDEDGVVLSAGVEFVLPEPFYPLCAEEKATVFKREVDTGGWPL